MCVLLRCTARAWISQISSVSLTLWRNVVEEMGFVNKFNPSLEMFFFSNISAAQPLVKSTFVYSWIFRIASKASSPFIFGIIRSRMSNLMRSLFFRKASTACSPSDELWKLRTLLYN